MALIRLLLAVLLAGAATVSPAADPARYMTAELIAESPAPAPGRAILVGIRMKPKPGWHGYWSNPGDAGFATTVRWAAPLGVKFGPLEHPAPVLLTADGISSYVHEGEHVLLSRMTLPRSFAPGTPVPIEARLNWAACTATMCVPLQATLTLDLTVGDGGKGPDAQALRTAQAKLPRGAPPGTYSSEGRTVRLKLRDTLRLDPRRARFFPDDNDVFETAAGRAEMSSEGIFITGPSSGKLTGTITGVVTDGRVAYRVSLKRKELKSTPLATAAKTEPPLTSPHSVSAEGPGASSKPPAQQPAPARVSWSWLIIAAALVAVAIVILLRRRLLI